MKPGTTHDEVFASLPALALDAVDASERAGVLSHVADCEICRAELESLRATASSLAFAAPLAADTATMSRGRIRDKLTARATAEGQARRLAKPPLVFPKEAVAPTPLASRSVPFHRVTSPSAHPAHSPSPSASSRHPAEWVALVAGILFVVTLGALLVSWNDRANLQDKLVSQPIRDMKAAHRGDSLTALIGSNDSMIAGLVGRDVTMMTLTSRSAKDAYARVFWDRSRNSWTLFARSMPALKAGRTYQLWIVTAKATVSGGTFDVVNGAGAMRATFAVSPDNLRAIAITEEPAGGVAQPTGETILSVTR